MGPRGHFYLGMSLAIRDIYIFRWLIGSQQTPGFWGVTENRDDMLRMRIRYLGDSTHSGLEGHGLVKVRRHPWDGLVDSIQSRHQL